MRQAGLYVSPPLTWQNSWNRLAWCAALFFYKPLEEFGHIC